MSLFEYLAPRITSSTGLNVKHRWAARPTIVQAFNVQNLNAKTCCSKEICCFCRFGSVCGTFEEQILHGSSLIAHRAHLTQAGKKVMQQADVDFRSRGIGNGAAPGCSDHNNTKNDLLLQLRRSPGEKRSAAISQDLPRLCLQKRSSLGVSLYPAKQSAYCGALVSPRDGFYR